MKKIPGTNVHTLDEILELVSWRGPRGFGRYHLARPRSQRGVSYCGVTFVDQGAPQTRLRVSPRAIVDRVLELNDVCGNCAREFTADTATVHGGEKFHELPDVWLAIFKRRRRRDADVWGFQDPDVGTDEPHTDAGELEALATDELERDREPYDAKGGPF